MIPSMHPRYRNMSVVILRDTVDQWNAVTGTSRNVLPAYVNFQTRTEFANVRDDKFARQMVAFMGNTFLVLDTDKIEFDGTAYAINEVNKRFNRLGELVFIEVEFG